MIKIQEEQKKLKTELENRTKLIQDQTKIMTEQNAKIDEIGKKQEAIKEELGKKMAEIKGIVTVTSKTQEAEFNKLQDQRL